MAVELKYNYVEAIAAMENFNQKDINSLREWTQALDKSKCVPKDLTDQQLVLFYNACNADMERSRRCIEKYYACRRNAPEFFSDRRVDADDVKESVEALGATIQRRAATPKNSENGFSLSDSDHTPNTSSVLVTTEADIHTECGATIQRRAATPKNSETGCSLSDSDHTPNTTSVLVTTEADIHTECGATIQRRAATPKNSENRFSSNESDHASDRYTSSVLATTEAEIHMECEFAVLPQQSPEGYDVVYHRLHHTDPSKYHLVAGIKLLLMTVDACLHERGPQRGVIFLFDMRGVKLTHLTRLSVGTLRKFFTYVQEAMPLQMRAIHVMNAVSFFDKVLAVLRPFMDKNLVNMIKLHTSTEDMAEFYAKVLPRDALPPDYGGTLPDTRALHALNTRRLRDMRAHFDAEEAQRARADPSASSPAASAANGIAQGFARLDID